MADMADMCTKTKDGAGGARARRVMHAVCRTPKSAFRPVAADEESYRQSPAEKEGVRGERLIGALVKSHNYV
jgi:hypothetical protein